MIKGMENLRDSYAMGIVDVQFSSSVDIIGKPLYYNFVSYDNGHDHDERARSGKHDRRTARYIADGIALHITYINRCKDKL
jgi:hypothetical protein